MTTHDGTAWPESWLPFTAAKALVCGWCGKAYTGRLRSWRHLAHLLAADCADVLGD